MGFYLSEINNYSIWKHSDLEDLEHGFFCRGLDVSGYNTTYTTKFTNVAEIALLKQVHGAKIISPIGLLKDNEYEADGFIISKGEPACGIKTADCTPLILINRDHTFSSILHCGWRSTVEGIVLKALKLFFEIGIKPEDILSYSGPCAQICCYEIGDNIKRNLLDASYTNFISENEIVQNRDGKLYASVTSIIKSQLLASSILIENINTLEECTICGNNYYSHRKGDKQRLLSYIKL